MSDDGPDPKVVAAVRYTYSNTFDMYDKDQWSEVLTGLAEAVFAHFGREGALTLRSLIGELDVENGGGAAPLQ